MTAQLLTPNLIPGILLTDKNLAGILKVSRGQIWALVKQGNLPPPLKLSTKTTRWKSDAIIALLEEIA